VICRAGRGRSDSCLMEHFEFAFAPSYRAAALPFGVTPATAWVEVGEDSFVARFGPWRVSTARSNIADVAITGPYRFYRTAGPSRLAITDRGLTFATNGERGVLILFHERIRGLDPLGLIRHPELTVTVADVEGLASVLRQSLERASGPSSASSPLPGT
jgi:hypothetical protein